MQNEFDIIVIGGGAAGVFAAINVARKDASLKIAILEKSSKLLSKVKVSGGGRCNVTHACFNPKELVKFYPRGQKELIGPFHQFQPGDTIEWFANKGIELKIEEDGRMFPITDNSQTIIDCFMDELNKHHINVHYNTEVTAIEKTENDFILSTNNKDYHCRHLMIATGGFNKTKHYHIISELGHTVNTPVPSLFTFNLPKNPILNLQGTVSNAEISILDSNYTDMGPLLITHWGMSGPAILKLSSWAARFLADKNYDFYYKVNWAPEHNPESISALILQQKSEHPAKNVLNHLEINLPKKLKQFLVEKSGIPPNTKWGEVSKKQVNDLAEVLTKDHYHSQGKTTFKQEFVSCGGVKLSEVNFKTMESKLVPGLFFGGEVLDIDALTGGFNFQAAWTTGWIAAQHMGI